MVELSDDVMRISLMREVDESYYIVFGENLFSRIATDLRDSPLGSRHAIITDSNVGHLFAAQLEDSLRGEGLDVQTFSFEAGEDHKTIDSCIAIIGEMSHMKYGRDSAVLALGGGVVGDMAGFIAAIFNRGIPYVQIPTTVLAQADSSIGGKTAVDTEYGKNLVGAFKQPERVYIDVATLQTLPERGYRSGLAETIKHGIILDVELFEYLQRCIGSAFKPNPEFSLHIARNNCRIKGNIVEVDPYEKGLRKVLNYGHTAGHAIEKLSVQRTREGGHPDYLAHGEAISIGMMVAGRIANFLGYLSNEDLSGQERLLKAAKLPTTIPPEIGDEAIIEVTSRDKKARGGRAMYVLPIAIGRMHDFSGKYATYVDNSVVLEALKQTR